MCGVGVARTWKSEEQRPGVPGMEHLQAGPGLGEQEGRQYRAGARARAESGAIIGLPLTCGLTCAVRSRFMLCGAKRRSPAMDEFRGRNPGRERSSSTQIEICEPLEDCGIQLLWVKRKP
jgi:hypothetical protein